MKAVPIPLATHCLTKIYHTGKKQTKVAVNNLSIEVPEGVIFGFLGPNGAGKTTTIKMILDFIRPTAGTVMVFGKPTTDAATRSFVGYLPEQPYFHRFLRPIEVLSMHAALAGVDRSKITARAMDALERAGIAEYAETPISKLSKGLTQRVGIAQALVADAQLLILDEPTSGLDPIGRRHTRDLLIQLRNEGRTVFLSSHLLSEVENLCDIVAVLKKGILVAYGTPDEVRSQGAYIRIVTRPIDQETAGKLKFLEARIERLTDSTLLRVDPISIYSVMRAMEQLNLPILHIETERESLEEAFLRLAA